MKKTRFSILVVAALVLMLALSACGGTPSGDQAPGGPSTQPPDENGGANQEDVNLAYLSPNHGNPFWATVARGVEDTTAKMGAQVTVYDAQDDPARQVSQAEDALLKGIDALLVSPFETDTGTAIAELANEAGVPVFILDNGADADYNAFIAADNLQGGRVAADYILEELGASANIAEMQGLVGREIPARRGVGFNEVMDNNGVKVRFAQPADFSRSKGMDLMENYLTQDKTLDAVFFWNDEMALGAKEAVAANGLTGEILLVGFDATEEAVQAVKDGEMAATVAQNPYAFGVTGVELAFKEFSGESYDKEILIECILVTQDNADEFLGK